MKDTQIYQPRQTAALQLDANESSLNLPEHLRRKIADKIADIDFNRYPDTACTQLRKAYATFLHKEPEQILAGNGSDQMLGLLISLFAGPGKTVLTRNPDFGMYDYYAGLQNAKVEKKETFQELKEAARDADLILFSNPNNPTGQQWTKDQIRELASQNKDIPIIIDEAYVEFANSDVMDLLDELPNLYITRTLSKAYRSASLRCGFLISSKANIANIEPYAVPYACSTLMQTAATQIIQEMDTFQPAIDQTRQERERLYSLLKDIVPPTVTVHPSQTNFIYLTGTGSDQLIARLEQANIKVRTWPGQPRLRITVGLPEENDRLVQALKGN